MRIFAPIPKAAQQAPSARSSISRLAPSRRLLQRQPQTEPPAKTPLESFTETMEAEGRVSIPVQEADPNCPCNQFAPAPCTTLQRDKINAAHTLAQQRLWRATMRMWEHVHGRSSPAESTRVTTALRANFRSESVKRVAERMGTLAIRSKNALCEPHCTPTCQDPKHVAYAPRPWRNSQCYEFCPPFFTKGPSEATRILIHEMAHSWLGVGGEQYKWKGEYPPIDSLLNADSYAWLAHDLGQ